MGSYADHAATTAVFPVPVGPTSTGTQGRRSLTGAPCGSGSGTPEPAFQLPARELHDRGPAVHVVGREGGAKQLGDELAHLRELQGLPLLDVRETRVRLRA